jgi:hypothetical protein
LKKFENDFSNKKYSNVNTIYHIYIYFEEFEVGEAFLIRGDFVGRGVSSNFSNSSRKADKAYKNSSLQSGRGFSNSFKPFNHIE